MSKQVQSHLINFPQETVSFDTQAFDFALRSHGVLMEHWRAIRCPLGVNDRFDVRSHNDHSQCSNGFIYKLAGVVTVLFTGNTTNSRLDTMGILDGSTVQVTVPRTYDDSDKDLAIQTFDRFYLKELATTSVNTQLVEAHITGIDRLQYKADYVEYIIDSLGNEYSEDDYSIVDGNIVWSQRRPPFDTKMNKGSTYSIRYRYTPYWYVDRLIHEVRVSRVIDYTSGQNVLYRMPHSVLLKREYLFENENRVRNVPSEARDVKSPHSGSFGER